MREPAGSDPIERGARQLSTQGFTLLEGLLPGDLVALLAERMRRQWHAHGAPALFSQADVIVSDRVHVSPVGMTVAGILEPIPEAARVLLRPELMALVGAVLGPGARIELGAGVVSDHTRPFFFWHHHVGGIDGADLRGRYPAVERIERLVCTAYLCPLDEEHGTMLVWPRAVGEPTAPPYPPGREPWPGCLEVRAPPGSVILFDQATWHAVTPMKRSGMRSFVAFFVTRGDVPAARRSDPTIPAAMAASVELARAYGAALAAPST